MMSETLTKLDNLSKTVRASGSARIVLHGRSHRRAASESRTKKFCGNKTSTSGLNTWKFDNLFTPR